MIGSHLRQEGFRTVLRLDDFTDIREKGSTIPISCDRRLKSLSWIFCSCIYSALFTNTIKNNLVSLACDSIVLSNIVVEPSDLSSTISIMEATTLSHDRFVSSEPLI
jgi:hypothetical protein